MTEKAKVQLLTGGTCFGVPCAKHMELNPGDTLVITGASRANCRVIPAKGPQPEETRGGWSYRYDRGGERYRYRPDPCVGWMDLHFGAVGGIAPDFLRFLADLKEATEKWHAS